MIILPKVRALWRLSEGRARAALDVNRKTLFYRPIKPDESVLDADQGDRVESDPLPIQTHRRALKP
jgi:hypothetical protein